MSVLYDIHQVHPSLGIEGLYTKIIQYEHIQPLDFLKFFQDCSFRFGNLEHFHNTGVLAYSTLYPFWQA